MGPGRARNGRRSLRAMTVTLPDGFVWGVAGAAHQIEGGNWNNDWWAFEHAPGTPCAEVSGDCCDSVHRYADDIALVAALGFGSYRFSLEWSRIEPEDGEFSRAALDYYRRVIATCHEHGIAPVVTFHHFTTPRWMADRGGWAEPEVVDKFARFCERSVAALRRSHRHGAARSTSPMSCRCSGYLDRTVRAGTARLLACTRRPASISATPTLGPTTSLKADPGDFPVGLTVSMSRLVGTRRRRRRAWSARGRCTRTSTSSRRAATTSSACRRTRARASASTGCRWIPTRRSETVESMGYEYWPQSLEAAIRHADRRDRQSGVRHRERHRHRRRRDPRQSS